MARDKVKRAFIWLRNTLRIIEKTTLPGEVLGEIRPTVDTFGWDRLSPESAGPGVGPTTENQQSILGGDVAALSVVPQGIMRYVFAASASHDDPVAGGLALSIQRRNGGLDIGLTQAVATAASPVRHGLLRSILLAPGEQLLARSTPAPVITSRIFVRMLFVDIDAGEYILPR